MREIVSNTKLYTQIIDVFFLFSVFYFFLFEKKAGRLYMNICVYKKDRCYAIAFGAVYRTEDARFQMPADFCMY